MPFEFWKSVYYFSSYEQKTFPVKTGSRFSATTFFCHHYDKTWTHAVWISKIRPLVLILLAKSHFPSKPEVDFQWQQFLSSPWSNLYICRLNFENPSISSHVISKKSFSVQTGSRFSATTIFCHHFDWTWKYAVWILKICPILLMLWAKTRFRRSFSIFLAKPEVDFKNQRWCALFPDKPEFMPFKFWKSVH